MRAGCVCRVEGRKPAGRDTLRSVEGHSEVEDDVKDSSLSAITSRRDGRCNESADIN